ncbi:MAG TPA: 16S rRNA (cytidine(1402)-2'-O)-methyltransferase [Stellaceae bacterium]|nr:16S rRNA (cytidine(1402)-2'-O)-methyltransferase [Stellaceae bacterium]
MSLDTKSGREPIGPAARSKHDARDADAIAPGLYVVATPIGNADDITLRALRVLRQADVIACEDTRVSAKLLRRHGIATERVSYHDHNAARMGPVLIERIAAGAAVALISDAGTPLVSDPGYALVRAAIARGVAVTVVPGPSAPVAALVLSGLPAERFLFAGFLPPKAAARRRALETLKPVPATLVFLEAAPRLAAALADMAEVLGDRPAAVARELTKLFEEVRRDRLAALAATYRAAGPPKGEIVVVVGPPEDAPAIGAAALDDALRAALVRMSVKDASAAVAAATGLPRRAVYARALQLVGSGS